MTELAAGPLVVNLQVVGGTAILTAPSVTVKHLRVQPFKGLDV
jgi:hypothetical protein